tara:strand:+ start:19920 stop:20669 length:750 start_codon:yes stop_codon:yes gene_type:complete
MSWFTAELRRHVPQARGQDLTPTGFISGAVDASSQFVDFSVTTFVKDPLSLWGRGDIGEGINKLGQNIFAQDEGSLWGKGSQMLHSFRDFRKHPAFGFVDKGVDYMIPDKYQDVFKGTPQMGIPNIPMPGHGAVRYLNDRTQQLSYVYNKLDNFRSFANEKWEELKDMGKLPGDLASLADRAGTGEEAAKPKKVKGSGSLKGKPARFAMNTGGKNEGRRSLKIGRSGRGGSGGDGAGFFKSYKSGRRSE